jgi:tetratricopeptide (TPR) repeat protein
VRTCTICRRPNSERSAIDEALVRGDTFRHVASQYGTNTGALQRHKRHLAREIAENTSARTEKATAVAERALAEKTLQADDLLARAQALHDEAVALLAQAKSQNRLRDALLAVREASSTLRLLGEVLGRLQSAAQISFTLFKSPEWLSLQAKILATLERFPEAHEAVKAALRGSRGYPDTAPALPAPTAWHAGDTAAAVAADDGTNRQAADA